MSLGFNFILLNQEIEEGLKRQKFLLEHKTQGKETKV